MRHFINSLNVIKKNGHWWLQIILNMEQTILKKYGS